MRIVKLLKTAPQITPTAAANILDTLSVHFTRLPDNSSFGSVCDDDGVLCDSGTGGTRLPLHGERAHDRQRVLGRDRLHLGPLLDHQVAHRRQLAGRYHVTPDWGRCAC